MWRRVSDPPKPGRRPGSKGKDSRGTLLARFLTNDDLQVRSNIPVQLHRNRELANRLQRLVQLNLAPVDVEALLLQSLSDIAPGYRPKELIIFSRLAGERNLEPVKLLG